MVVFFDAPFALQVIALEATDRFVRDRQALAQICAWSLSPLRIMIAAVTQNDRAEFDKSRQVRKSLP
jgi:hypothetical protein